MSRPLILEAVRTPFGRRNGGLSGMHPAKLIGAVYDGLVRRTGVDPVLVEEVIAGCVGQVGAQAANIARTGWLASGLPTTTAGTTVDTQCGSSQQAAHVVSSFVAAGALELGIAAGVEVMSKFPIGIATTGGPGNPRPDDWTLDMPNQFVGADRIARDFGLTREDLDRWGATSQGRAAAAWARGAFQTEIVEVDAPELDGEQQPTGRTVRVSRDEGLRSTSLDALAALRTIMPDGLHTAGTASQISDGAAGLMIGSEGLASRLGLQPRAVIIGQCVIGDDPYYQLNGPIAATERLLKRLGLTVGDLDVIEINEAFSSVVLNWIRHFEVDAERVNVNGGAIALGHPVGASGARLLGTALNQLEATGKRLGLVVMCNGGAQATATIIERL